MAEHRPGLDSHGGLSGHVQVTSANPTTGHADQQLIRGRARFGDLTELQGLIEIAEYRCFHQ
jgi:hypothetical protein